MRPLALLLPLAACDSGAGPDAERNALLTDERAYVRDGSLAVHVSLANVSDAPVYVASPSFDTVLERREGGRGAESGRGTASSG